MLRWACRAANKEVQIVFRFFLVNWYLLHVSRLLFQPASSGRGWVIDFLWFELLWQYIAMTRNNLSIILISLAAKCVIVEMRCIVLRGCLIWPPFYYMQFFPGRLLINNTNVSLQKWTSLYDCTYIFLENKVLVKIAWKSGQHMTLSEYGF